jgi:DNA polymerase-3 subunit gamma/tau
MSYQVLARKWRPHRFAEVVGQEHVVRALTNALDEGRVHHAFLFTGTRGVGKTSIARIFAKALNCERGVSAEPCGECAVCVDVDAGRFVDLIEVDAASRTKADDTRELMDNVQYAPAVGRFKVYLIDEVHMFSTHSFNALLKTLEEPPPHVKFLLATTDPKKLPVTVLSRCLQFNLRKLTSRAIAEHLIDIVQRESVEYESAAIAALARAADGSIRDGLSLLDQAIAYGGGRVGTDDVAAMLGSVDREVVSRLLRALARSDARSCLAEIADLDQKAPDYLQVLGELGRSLQLIAVRQVADDIADDDVLPTEALSELALALSPEDVQLYYQIALHGRRDLPLSTDPRGAFEMTLLRMLAFRPPPRDTVESAAKADGGNGREHGAAPSRGKRPAVRKKAGAGQVADGPGADGIGDEKARKGADAGSLPPIHDWDAVVQGLGLKGVALQLARHCRLDRREGGYVRLVLDRRYENLRNKAAEDRLKNALGRAEDAPVRLELVVGDVDGDSPAGRASEAVAARREAAAEAIDMDPNVAELKSRFGATINPDSIEPLD